MYVSVRFRAQAIGRLSEFTM